MFSPIAVFPRLLGLSFPLPVPVGVEVTLDIEGAMKLLSDLEMKSMMALPHSPIITRLT